MMKRFTLGIVFLSIVITAPVWAQVIPGEYIVVLHDDVNPAEVASEYAHGNGAVPQHVYQKALKGFSAEMPPGLAMAMANDPRVKYVEPNQLMYANGQKPIIIKGKPDRPSAKPPKDDPTPPPPQVLPTGIDRIDAELSSGFDGVDADIAIIDTGVSDTHPDLNFFKGITYISRGKAVSGGVDDNGHGSHVAGIAAARNNTIGVVGVAPGARIWSVKVLNRSGVGSVADIIMGVEYVTDHADEIEVANMSLGGGISETLDDAVVASIAAGVVYVVAAGNESSDASYFSPARVSEAITVSAITDTDGAPGSEGFDLIDSNGVPYNDDTFAAFSNYGECVDIAAPGVWIYSTYKGAGYETMSGTSMAAPHVTGAVALLLAKGVSQDYVNSALETTAWQQGSDNGFTGDPDGYDEPLLNVGSF